MANGFLFLLLLCVGCVLRKTIFFNKSFFAAITLLFQVAAISVSTIAGGCCFRCCCVSCVTKKKSVWLTNAILNAISTTSAISMRMNAISTMTNAILMKTCDSGRRCGCQTIYDRDLNPENLKENSNQYFEFVKLVIKRLRINSTVGV